MAINRESMKSLPIQGYLDWQGIGYTRTGKRLKLIEHDSCVIDTEKNRFIWNKTGQAGDLGDFISAYKNVDLKQAFREWTAYSRYVNDEDVDLDKYNQKVSKKEFNYQKWRKSNNPERAFDYLTQERNLDPHLTRELLKQGLVQEGVPSRDYETKKLMQAPVLFPWADENRKIVGVDVQGTDIDYEQFGKRGTSKRVGAGSNGDYGYNIQFGNGSDRLVIFEAPIDLLSYMQQNQSTLVNQNTTLYSLTGTNHQKVFRQLERMQLVNGHLPQNVTVATDKDIAGFQVAARLNNFDYKAGTMTREVPVYGKDWNEQLKAQKVGIRSMSLDESDQELKRLENFVEQQQKVPDNQSNFDAHAVVKPTSIAKQKDANTQVKENQPNTRSTSERRQINREKNQAVIASARKHFESLHDNPEDILKHLDFVSLGQQFSPRNAMLITAQQPNSSIVMGYEQFQQKGIGVNKGEQGIRIYGRPQTMKAFIDEAGDKVFIRDATPAQKQKLVDGKLEKTEAAFYPIETVFDIKQTNATPEQVAQIMPVRPINLQVDNSVKHQAMIYAELKEVALENGYQVQDDHNKQQFEQQPANHQKSFKVTRDKNTPGKIQINEQMDLPDKLTTLVREIGQVKAMDMVHHDRLTLDQKHLQGDLASYSMMRGMNISSEAIKQRFMPELMDELGKNDLPKNKFNQFMAETTQSATQVTHRLSSKFSAGERKESQTQTFKQKGSNLSKEQTQTNNAQVSRGRT